MGEKTIQKDAKIMIEKLKKEGIDLVWDRLEKQEPQCGFCALGLSCRNCAMGPCRINPFGDEPQKGVCGADADIIVARNLARAVASGAASHSDHGRDLVEVLALVGKIKAYSVRDGEKLKRLAQEYGIDTSKSVEEIAHELAESMMEDFGSKKERIQMIDRAPKRRLEIWEKLRIIPRGIDREVVELMHRTHMGVDNDPVNILLQCMRASLADGFGGSMIATEVSDILFGTPQPKVSTINLATLKKNEVNVILHGHNPIVSEAVVEAASDEEITRLAKEAGADGINLAGLCCTGNEVLMRKGIPMAGNHLLQELVIGTGVVDVIIVDYQCIMPGIVDVAKCYHTAVVTTSPKAKFKGAIHIEFTPENADEKAREVLKLAIERFRKRNPDFIKIPDVKPMELMTGFSVEAIVKALGGTLQPLIDAIKEGSIKGVVGSVGCNNPKVRQDYGHTVLAKKLIENDVLVLDTGCAAVADAKAGLKRMGSANLAGDGLKKVCEALKIPPVLHVGSCVDNSRILVALCALANELGVDISDLPAAGAAMEWYSEKAIAIGTYFVSSGLLVVLGVPPPIHGSQLVLDVLTNKVEELTGGKFVVEPDPEKAAEVIIKHIDKKRKKLGI
ncbi:MAG: anaerobic carbon-monoxide dehydrogenase catalytic subunit [Archaeoglobaceae archaeon]|nr:anaerobic carbon-monoxide dehydrogenase catalytic subunit [Archaeoglobaceae archaeon]MDK2876486.1 anaerobic carbon-monoxide dehydrogenase catalytic subunit [Archaeoglobaceae archaeon]